MAILTTKRASEQPFCPGADQERKGGEGGAQTTCYQGKFKSRKTQLKLKENSNFEGTYFIDGEKRVRRIMSFQK